MPQSGARSRRRGPAREIQVVGRTELGEGENLVSYEVNDLQNEMSTHDMLETPRSALHAL